MYPGSKAGKVIARTFAHAAMQRLNPVAYNEGEHLYLAGSDAGDIIEATRLGIPSSRLHAAEIDWKRGQEAAANMTRHGLPKSCIKPFDMVHVAKEIGKSSVIFVDTCGQFDGALQLMKKLYPYLAKDGIMAINIAYGRDTNLSQEANAFADDLSVGMRKGGHKSPSTAFAAHALATDNSFDFGNHIDGYREVFFPIGIAYSNTGVDKKKGAPMLTLIGKFRPTRTHKEVVRDILSSKNPLRGLEPAYFARFSPTLSKPSYWLESTDQKLRSHKAHLPSTFKKELPRLFAGAAAEQLQMLKNR